MTFEQLEYFMLIEKYKSFSRAAEENYLSQPTLFKQIKALEKELGVELFVRTSRSIRLTDAGREFSQFVHKVMQEYYRIKTSLRDYGKSKKKLVISTIPVAPRYGLLKVIREFCKFYENVDVELVEQNTDLALKALENDTSDMAFIRSKYIPDGEYGAYPLIKDELVLVVSKDHPFAQEKSIFLRDAQYEQFIFLGTNTGLYRICMDECRRAGFIPKARERNVRVETLEELLIEENCASLLMNSVASRLSLDKLKIVRLKEHPQMDICLVLKLEQLTDLKKTFIEYATDYMMDYYTKGTF